MNPHRVRAYFLLLIVAAIWGTAGPIIKYTLGGFSPLTFLVYRFFLSSLVALFFIPQLIATFKKPLALILTLILYGLITAPIALGLLFFGMDKTTALDASLIMAISPLIVAGGGVLFLRERITKREKFGMLIALTGVSVTVLQPIFAGGSFGQFSGNLILLVYLFIGAFSSILVKKLLRQDIDPYSLANVSFILGFITLLPIALYKNGLPGIITEVTSAPWTYQLGVIYMAFLSGNLAYTLGNFAQKTIEISEAALFTYLWPIFAIPLAVLWLHETITTPYIIGAIVIAAGVFFAEYKKPKVAQ